MGGAKLTVALRGRPLIEYPLAALRTVLDDVAVIAKPDVELPALQGVMLWIEPEEPRHPLVGIVEALGLAAGRPVLVCPADLPCVTPSLVAGICQTSAEDAPAVIARHAGETQPLLGLYQPVAAALLADAARRAEAPVRASVDAIGPRHFEVRDAEELFNVNSPEDLLVARSILDRREQHSAGRASRT